MKKLLLLTLGILFATKVFAYDDHRGKNLDSLERAVARWTPDAIDKASEQELINLNIAYRDLMRGWQHLNSEKCEFYARRALSISIPRGWQLANSDAYSYVGKVFYGREQYDSALVYYQKALESVNLMAGGVSSPTNPNGYSQERIDDSLSSLYGTIGNLYNEMGNIPEAMEYYMQASEIFDKYGWNESSTILWYNIGETWLDEGEDHKAAKAYDKAEAYAKASGDSLMIILSYKGLGRLYMERGQTRKALNYLREVSEYYTVHPDDAPKFRRVTLELIDTVLTRQKNQLTWILSGSVFIILLLAGLLVLSIHLRKTKRENKEAEELIEETLEEITPQKEDINLSAREKDILDLLSKGYTAPQIGQALGLSNETIRWYRKKLIAKLDVSNTAELISQAKERELI